MRLVCPRCVAHYEVDDTAIPETGREVQCANCEHIWFQDSIQMLPDDEESAQNQGTAGTTFPSGDDDIFQDLEGVGDAQFKSTRELAVPDEIDLDEDVSGSLLDEDYGHDDEPPSEPDGALEVDEDEPDDAPEGLAEFLRAHEDSADMQGEVDPADTADEAELEGAEPGEDAPEGFDPLGDLDTIRDQMSQTQVSVADEEDGAEEAVVEYEPVLPQDDPLPETVAEREYEALGETPADEFAPEDLTVETDDIDTQDEDDLTDAAAALDDDRAASPERDIPEVDDREDAEPRRAYRADLAESDEAEPDQTDETSEDFEIGFDDEPVVELTDTDEGVFASEIPAPAALGAMRPRSRGRARVRTIPGTETVQSEASAKADSGEKLPGRAASDDTAPTDQPQPASLAASAESVSRKELLPDVGELETTLRKTAEQSRRSLEMGGLEETESRGGFRRAFIWTLFVVALLAALYVFRPQIVNSLPAASAFLDPYAAMVDTIRQGIDRFVGGVFG